MDDALQGWGCVRGRIFLGSRSDREPDEGVGRSMGARAYGHGDFGAGWSMPKIAIGEDSSARV